MSKSFEEKTPPPDLKQRNTAEATVAFEDRWKPVAEEMQWVIGGYKYPAQHKKILPDYCYPILDAYRRTVFKNLPLNLSV